MAAAAPKDCQILRTTDPSLTVPRTVSDSPLLSVLYLRLLAVRFRRRLGRLGSWGLAILDYRSIRSMR